jgi:hypothetical protein
MGAPSDVVMQRFGMFITRSRAKEAFMAANSAYKWIQDHPNVTKLVF